MGKRQEDSSIQRLAIIGDVHAEDTRLAIALEGIAELGVDTVACTGDIVDGYGAVDRCCELLQRHHVRCVRGNHDRWLFTGLLRDHAQATPLERVNAGHQAFLRALPPTLELPIDGGFLLLCHGIGVSDLAKITEYDSEYSIHNNRALAQVCQDGRYRVMVNGHSHYRLVMRVRGLTVVNAGALCEPDPGFVLLDLPKNLVQWYSIADGQASLHDEQALFP